MGHDRRHTADDRGASLVEFALLVPLFFMLVLGAVTGADSYGNKGQLEHAAKEATRYASTFPTGTGNQVSTGWLDSVADAALNAAGGVLRTSTPGFYSCVAYIGTGSGANKNTDVSRRRVQTASGTQYSNVGDAAVDKQCFSSTLTERHVQVLLRRNGEVQALLFTARPTLSGRGIARYEAFTTS